MHKILRIVFLVVALCACVQSLGIDEAFCCDSAGESGCRDCAACSHHPLAASEMSGVTPEAISGDRLFAKYFFQYSQFVPLQILRPPICF